MDRPSISDAIRREYERIAQQLGADAGVKPAT